MRSYTGLTLDTLDFADAVPTVSTTPPEQAPKQASTLPPLRAHRSLASLPPSPSLPQGHSQQPRPQNHRRLPSSPL